jgi:hypothetical protein
MKNRYTQSGCSSRSIDVISRHDWNAAPHTLQVRYSRRVPLTNFVPPVIFELWLKQLGQRGGMGAGTTTRVS